jgi:hypothetical protein
MALPPPLTQDFIAALAGDLAVEPPALRAVVAVESSGRGLFPEGAVSPEGQEIGGFPVVRLEAHVFWKELRKAGIEPHGAGPSRPDLLSPVRNDRLVKTAPGEWDRLRAARLLHRDAADSSASWGMFQIMGFNWGLAGAGSVQDFVRISHSLEGQAELFAGFVRGDPVMHRALRHLDWAGFARRYNGPGYARNGYHLKLAESYERFRKVK